MGKRPKIQLANEYYLTRREEMKEKKDQSRKISKGKISRKNRGRVKGLRRRRGEGQSRKRKVNRQSLEGRKSGYYQGTSLRVAQNRSRGGQFTREEKQREYQNESRAARIPGQAVIGGGKNRKIDSRCPNYKTHRRELC